MDYLCSYRDAFFVALFAITCFSGSRDWPSGRFKIAVASFESAAAVAFIFATRLLQDEAFRGQNP
jgi:hypothetical protein